MQQFPAHSAYRVQIHNQQQNKPAFCCPARFRRILTAEKEALQKELDKYRMELTLHRMTEMQRAAIEEAEAEQKANEEAKRLSLKDAFLARNREELLTLVNPWHELSEAYEPHLTEIGDGMLFDERAAGALKHMLEDAKAEGIIAVPISGYRTREYQQGPESAGKRI